jgi:hypothetical protein
LALSTGVLEKVAKTPVFFISGWGGAEVKIRAIQEEPCTVIGLVIRKNTENFLSILNRGKSAGSKDQGGLL